MIIDELLRQFASTICAAPSKEQGGALRGLQAALNLLNARIAWPSGSSRLERFDEGNLPSVLLSKDSSNEPQSLENGSSDEGCGGKRRISLLVPPKKEIGKHGLPIATYVSDDGEIRVWWAANKREAREIERFCKAAESFDINDPSTHVIEF